MIRNSISRFGTNPLSELKTVLALRKQIGQINPDAVITFTIKPNLYSLIAWGRKFPCHSECYRAQCLPSQIRTCSECYLKDSEHDVQKEILYSLSSNLISC